jgi:hypothetical protein
MVYFQTKNSKLGKFFKGLAMEEAGISYGHLVYFAFISYNLWPFINFLVNWYICVCFGKYYLEKSGNPDRSVITRCEPKNKGAAMAIIVSERE